MVKLRLFKNITVHCMRLFHIYYILHIEFKMINVKYLQIVFLRGQIFPQISSALVVVTCRSLQSFGGAVHKSSYQDESAQSANSGKSK